MSIFFCECKHFTKTGCKPRFSFLDANASYKDADAKSYDADAPYEDANAIFHDANFMMMQMPSCDDGDANAPLWVCHDANAFYWMQM